MFLALPIGMDIATFEDCLIMPTGECVNQIFSPDRLSRAIPPNPDRAQYLAADFLQMHFNSPATPGPVGHGLTQENIDNDTLYYTFDMVPEVVGIMMDTVNRSGVDGGSIGTSQATWLEQQLQANSSRYFDEHGQIVTTDSPDKLLVLFSHHNLLTLNNATTLVDDPDPIKLLADDIKQIVLRYPNVILWVNGHSHVNRVWAHRNFKSNTDTQTEFWEVNTASHIDFPQLSRSLEIVDNQDGTLSIYGVLLDHFAPARSHRRAFRLLDMASISRELAANDPDFFLDFQLGAPADRNVELLINKPFK
jgi:metallophosphoesterase (TIGR03767 family)